RTHFIIGWERRVEGFVSYTWATGHGGNNGQTIQEAPVLQPPSSSSYYFTHPPGARTTTKTAAGSAILGLLPVQFYQPLGSSPTLPGLLSSCWTAPVPSFQRRYWTRTTPEETAPCSWLIKGGEARQRRAWRRGQRGRRRRG
ncbi:unnamed protein product, partial [Heterosigma akashiwo]